MGSFSESILVRGLSFLADRQAAIANNLANVDTTSFKRRIAVAEDTGNDFHSLLEAEMPSIAYRELTDFARGVERETGNPLDLAIDGDYWLQVQGDEGKTYYTRNGQLQVDEEGQLVTHAGMRVLGQGGAPIQLGMGDAMPGLLKVSPNGTIQDSDSGQILGQIRLVQLDHDDALRPIGRGVFEDTTNQVGKPVGVGLRQGFLEGSNVESLQELVAMITVERSFAATQKALTGASRLQENIINNVLR